jgi:predicted permease
MAIEAFSRVLPVLLLVGLGVLIRQRAFLRPTTIDDLRKLVLNITLPAALFLAMLQVEIEAQYAVIVAGVFGACLVVLVMAPWLRRLARVDASSMPNLMAGFEAGMLGYALFGALFGSAALYRFAIVDIGQVLFVFFILAPVVMRRTSGKSVPLADSVMEFARTPVIIAIIGGILGSAIGLEDALRDNDLSDALLVTLGLLAALTTPLIAIVLGYSTSLRSGSLGDPLRTLAVRMPIWIILALLFNHFVIDGLLGLDRLFQAAVMTMAILPPPFVVPLYMARASDRDISADPEHDYTVNTLSLATIATLVAITVVGVLYAG